MVNRILLSFTMLSKKPIICICNKKRPADLRGPFLFGNFWFLLGFLLDFLSALAGDGAEELEGVVQGVAVAEHVDLRDDGALLR